MKLDPFGKPRLNVLLRETAYAAPRRFACRVFGIHSWATCAGRVRSDDVHRAWKVQVLARQWRAPWWDRVHPVEAVQGAYARVRDAIPFPAVVDLLISELRERRQRCDGWPSWSQQRRFPLDAYRCCAVCAARWRVGRGIRHARCGEAIRKAVDSVLATEEILRRAQ